MATKVSTIVGIRSALEKEVRPGIYEYDFKEQPVKATLLQSGTFVDDATSGNQNERPNIRISFLLSNDKTDRLSRLMYIVYFGVKYKITNIDRTQDPAVIVTLGEVWHG